MAAALAQLERDRLIGRTRAGLAAAKAQADGRADRDGARTAGRGKAPLVKWRRRSASGELPSTDHCSGSVKWLRRSRHAERRDALLSPRRPSEYRLVDRKEV